MSKTGLVSITFRQLSAREIIDLCKQAGVDAIEWGGDVHVPHGDLDRAREVAAMTRQAGLEVASYGSYYRTVSSEEDGLSFDTVLDTAEALGAPAIRVWAGNQGSADASEDNRKAVAENLQIAAEKAARRDIRVSLEFHGNTLTDDLKSAVALLEAVCHPNLKTLWQPSIAMTYEEQQLALRGVLPWLDYFHVFTWNKGDDGKVIREALAEGEERWKTFFADVRPPYALIEFVKGDAPEQFLADAATLKDWLT